MGGGWGGRGERGVGYTGGLFPPLFFPLIVIIRTCEPCRGICASASAYTMVLDTSVWANHVAVACANKSDSATQALKQQSTQNKASNKQKKMPRRPYNNCKVDSGKLIRSNEAPTSDWTKGTLSSSVARREFLTFKLLVFITSIMTNKIINNNNNNHHHNNHNNQ